MSGKFDLSVSFSQFNGAVVLSSEENSVQIGLTCIDDGKLREKLRKSVKNFFESNGKMFTEGSCSFVEIDGERLRHEISLRYGERERENGQKDMENESAMLLDTLLNEAGKRGATDIHIEEKRVRFRISGLLEDECELSLEKSRELVRRIKILADLNALETRKGQDGQFVFNGDDQIFVRVSTVPSVSGTGSSESVVLRLLNVSRVPLSLSELGFSESQCGTLRELLKKEQGLILISGATGSGKSTTAASLLSELTSLGMGRKKIIAIEDPPEYVLDGVTQIRVDDEIGMSFSDALRFVFRQDPDVIFVGEIRDSLTAKTVLQASLTGHLVFATVHTSGVMETAIRMKELGVDFSDFSSVLLAVIYQKLAVSEEKKKVILSAEVVTEADSLFGKSFSVARPKAFYGKNLPLTRNLSRQTEGEEGA